MNPVQIAIDALDLGAIYALAALGVGLIFSVMRLINFAHGELVAIAGFTIYATDSLPAPVRIVLALVAAIGLGLLMERTAFRPVRNASPTTLLITSFTVSYLIQHLVVMVFGSRAIGVSLLPWLSESMAIGTLRVPRIEVATIAVTGILLGGLVLFFRRTSLGIQMRAAAEDVAMARLVGIRTDRIIASAFAISGILAASLAVFQVIQSGSVSYRMGVDIILLAFVSAVVGGMGSLVGAAFGGLLVGVTSVCLQTFLPFEWRAYRNAFLFALFIAFLIWRPQGIVFRKSDRARV